MKLKKLFDSLELKGFLREQVVIEVNKDKQCNFFIDNKFIITCSFLQLKDLILNYITDVTFITSIEDDNENNIYEIIRKWKINESKKKNKN